GKPMAGFRTSTHSFQYPGGDPRAKWNGDFGRKIFGQQWITHHGHHGDKHLTDVKVVAERKDHPILRGVKPFKCFSWLYHVEGSKHKLYGDCVPLLTGTSIKSSHTKQPELYPQTNPVAWTKTHTGAANKSARV